MQASDSEQKDKSNLPDMNLATTNRVLSLIFFSFKKQCFIDYRIIGLYNKNNAINRINTKDGKQGLMEHKTMFFIPGRIGLKETFLDPYKIYI